MGIAEYETIQNLAREQFSSLESDTIFLENAGGSQVPRSVADRIRQYMLSSYVQLGAGYELSQLATATVEEARDFVRMLFNGSDGEVLLGPSTSSLLHMLAECYARYLVPGREVIVADTGHEANVGPWVGLERHGVTVKWWKVDPDTFSCSVSDLEHVLSDRTALVAFPHVSNLLGEIVDVEKITRVAHAAGARVVVDGVAFAPHRAMDVERWSVDWYAFSTYKVYGPHMAALWGRRDALAELEGPNHFFIDRSEVPYSFELGGVSHESCAGLLGTRDYLGVLAQEPNVEGLDRAGVERAFEVMTACELPVQQRLIDYFQSRTDVRVVGPSHAESSRVGTVSFVHSKKSSRAITESVDRSEVAIRHGHMYAYRLCEALGLDPEDGVVRVSLVHYNTVEEIDRLIEVLDHAMG